MNRQDASGKVKTASACTLWETGYAEKYPHVWGCQEIKLDVDTDVRQLEETTVKKQTYAPPKVKAYANGAIVTPQKVTTGLTRNGGGTGRRDGWSKSAKTRCKKFTLGIPYRDYEREGDRAYAVTLKLPKWTNEWNKDGNDRRVTDRVTGEQFKKTLNKMLENLVPRSNQSCTPLQPWKRVFWVIELRTKDATPHIHATVWTNQTEEDLKIRTQQQWVSLWKKCNIKVTAKHVHIKPTYDVVGWFQYMLKRSAPMNKKAQQDLLKYLTGIGNVWGYRPKSAFALKSPYEVELNRQQMYRVRRIMLKYEIRQEELRGSKRANKRKIEHLRSTLKCSYLNNVNMLEDGLSVDMLKTQRSRAYSFTSFDFNEAMVKRLIEYIHNEDG